MQVGRMLTFRYVNVFSTSRGVQLRYYTTPGRFSAGWKWFGIPTSLGIACIALVKLQRTLREANKGDGDKSEATNTWQVEFVIFRSSNKGTTSLACSVPTTPNASSVSHVGCTSAARDTNMAAEARTWALCVGLWL